MLMAGKNLTQPNDVLQSVTVQRLVDALKNSQSLLAQQVIQLRSLKLMDENQYRRLKTKLPYIVGSVFNPAVRKKENFVYASYFILDIDHITQFNRTVENLKLELQGDERILLCFISPGNDGLKLLFKLTQKIHDTSYYTLFYKQFAGRFATEHQIQGMVDVKTNDASRCCFMSYDPELWYHEHAILVNPTEFLNPDDVNDADNALFEIKVAVQEQNKELENIVPELPKNSILNDDILSRIKSRINPLMQQVKKEVYQPAQLDEIWANLSSYIAESEMQIEKITPISYGRQIRIRASAYWAEVNIFYGKRGFSVVPTTKTGSNTELAKLVNELLQQFFNQVQL